MEYKKKNWNSILNQWLTSIALVLATLLMGLCFITPGMNVNASNNLTKGDIVNEYNINFVSAKTKVRVAKGLHKTLLTEQKGNASSAPCFHSYQYDYVNHPGSKVYYGTNNDLISINGNNQLQHTLFTEYDATVNAGILETGYIPYGINYFDNVYGNKESIFYDDVEHNDYVLLNNHTSHNEISSNLFNVENLYLSFGSPYVDELTTTPLASLKVEGKLYSEGRVHYLALNETHVSDITYLKDSNANGSGNKIEAHFWNQYFDLRDLLAYETNEIGSKTYNVQNQQGRYEFKFYFIRYNEKLEPVNVGEEVFTYSFYLLDSAQYTQYPTINNAELLDDLHLGKTNEYFYNFAQDTPFIKYDPTKFNIAFTRSSNKSNIYSPNITSNYVSSTYTIAERENRKYPLGIVTYYNGSSASNIAKQVYILTNYNNDKTLVEYLYLSITNPTSTPSIPTSYTAFANAVNNGLMKFEYKTTVVRINETNAYTTYTYKSTSFENYPLIFKNISSALVDDMNNLLVIKDSENNTIAQVNQYDSEKITVDNQGQFKITNAPVAIIAQPTKTNNLIAPVKSGVTLNVTNLTQDATLNNNSTKYTLNKNILTKEYLDLGGKSQTYNIVLNADTIGDNITKDPIHNNITINYTVGDDSDNPITAITFAIADKLAVSEIEDGVNYRTLEKLIDPSQIQLEYSYELELEELGVYDITYSYICPADDNNYYINSTLASTNNNYYSNSTNYLTPKDFDKTLSKDDDNPTSHSESLNFVASGFIGESVANTITLNGKTYTYNPSTNQVSVDTNMYNLNTKYSINYATLGSNDIHTTFKVDNVAGKLKLSVIYEIGDITTETTNETLVSLLPNKDDAYRKFVTTYTKYIYTLTISSSTISNTADWADLKAVLTNIEKYNKEVTKYTQTVKNPTIVTETTQGKDILHIYGSISYFNKADNYTDSKYAKFKQIDKRLGLNYVSDVTSLYIESNNAEMFVSNPDASAYKKGIASLLNKDNIIITDVTPILWNNFSTLSYSSKKSLSYIYRYTDYSFAVDGSIVYDAKSAIVSTYSKDIYCQFDGLYEIVIFYKYDGLPSSVSNLYCYQLFTFIIDNSSPELIIEVKNDSGTYEPLGLNTYTNKDVRLSWEVPSYFKNDIYIEINKTYYNENNTSFNFNSIYKQNTITTTSGNDSYVKNISSMSTYKRDDKNFYYVELKVKSGADITHNLNGKYKIIMHYNANGRSTFAEEFIIDKQNIAGLNILSVVKDNDGSYKVSKGQQFDSQLINTDFTFRFNKKESGANIFVYYDKVDFVNTEDYDDIINATNGFGITTKFYANGANPSIGTPYVYNYTHLDNYYNVDSDNLITSNNSSLFLFRLEDEAGNTCRYVVFYDKTEPRFIVTPTPDAITHSVTDTARVVWGDYKAIKVATPVSFEIANLNDKVDNYSKEESEDKLDLMLRYLNTNNYFDGLKVELINDNYYILVPITNVLLEDRTYNNPINVNDVTEYYFFPVNPIETVEGSSANYVTLPSTDNAGNYIKTTYEILSYSTTTATVNGETNPRYITITYYTDSTKTTTKTIRGVFGQKGSSTPSHTYIYTVYDAVNNKSSGALTVTVDRTLTYGFGLFDYSDNISNAICLEENNTAYSTSKLFISSKVSEDIPAFTVTYKHYPYDTGLYTDYTVDSITLLNSTNTPTITNDNESYLQLDMTHKTQADVTKSIKIPLTNADGGSYPKFTYPYSLDGNTIVAGSNGEPLDIYSDGYTYINNDQTRKYSLAINTTTDTNKQKVVTEEGLYIFQRTYTDEDLDITTLGNDSRIVYYVYYIDRTGIINITTNHSVASKLYNIGNSIEFTLGSNYSDESYKKIINAETIQNNQTSISSNTSNSSYASEELFETNKIQVEFTMAYDKHNFEEFIFNYKDSFLYATTDNNLKTIINNQLFNKDLSAKYKTELKLNVGGISTNGTTIINEKEYFYDSVAIASYLKGSPMVNATTRSNHFNFFYDTGSNFYIININDQAGYLKHNSDGTVTKNYLPNNLKITFDIQHNAPEGEMYGKYYGRHDYDNNSEVKSNPSIPIENNTYQLLSKYLKEGQLEPLSDGEQSIQHTTNGDYIKLYSTNNETMIFTFSITKDEYKAQIDPNNIKIYKGAINNSNLIFNRTDGNNIDTSLVSANRQRKSFIINEIDGITYYAIIIFDNNLDQILDEKEFHLYSEYRLLDAEDNIDRENYYIQINYLGNANDYVGEDSLGNPLSFYNTTYQISVDRIKPTYNLTKLMNLDRYVYHTINTSVTTSNYEDVFKLYHPVYNFTLDEEHDFYRTDLENYFFAVDHREKTSFKFESIDTLDNNRSLYIRRVNKNNYKFSLTPDDYKAYYDAVYLQGHPQFTPSNATAISNDLFDHNGMITLVEDKYYQIQFNLDGENDNSISAYYLRNHGIFKENNYYEIIEVDETGNYRVYAIYIPVVTIDPNTPNNANKVVYTYQRNVSSPYIDATILYGNTPYTDVNGMNLAFTTIQQKDNFLRANINIDTNKISHKLDIIFDPNKLTVTVTNRTTQQILPIQNQVPIESRDVGDFTNTAAFMNAINEVLNYYHGLINNKQHAYYSQFGYNVKIDIVDRIGISMTNMKTLYNYEINYVVAGSTLSPIFIDNNYNFTMRLEGQKGSTFLTSIKVYKFNKEWTQISVDNSSTPKIFNLTIAELKKPIDYIFTRGVYKFIFTDNFGRTNQFFHEYGISSSQTGGVLNVDSPKSIKLDDGYLYTAKEYYANEELKNYDITYTYDSSVYNVYIKFVGKYKNENGDYIYFNDEDNEIIYDSSAKTYTDSELKNLFGVEVRTSSITTTITFTGSAYGNLSKYHIKAVLASTAENYSWGDEDESSDIVVHNHKLALYSAIQEVRIKNLSGNTLNTNGDQLNLTEDFELIIAWNTAIPQEDRINFNSKIILIREYYDEKSGQVKIENGYSVNSGHIISKPGTYTAYIINDLGMTSNKIRFTRGDGEISMYAVYAVDSNSHTEKKLTPSPFIETHNDKVLFTYFTTNDYFGYKDSITNNSIVFPSQNNLGQDNKINLDDFIRENIDSLTTNFVINVNAAKYLDVRVNSNLSIMIELDNVEIVGNNAQVIYRVYSNTAGGGSYTYRYIRIVFIDYINNKSFANITVTDSNIDNIIGNTNLAEQTSIITNSTDSIYVEFKFFDESTNSLLSPQGNTIFVDRYYNGKLVETTTINNIANTNQIPVFKMNITTVGLHEFVIRDLAGRVHHFANESKRLKIYLINQVLFTVNGSDPINNQIFNDKVKFDIIFNLSGLQLYTDRSLSVTIFRNGSDTNIDGSNGAFVISDPGYYTIKMTASTILSQSNEIQIQSTYNFVIIDPNIAQKSFSISKGSGFGIEKLIRISGNSKEDLTETYDALLKANAEKYNYKASETLLWFAHKENGNSIFDITLKKYDELTKTYRTFNFKVWINDARPTIKSSIPEGTDTKDVINIHYNPGLIYTQIGNGYIELNNQVITTIDENSKSSVDTLSIDKKGTYWLRIYKADGTLVSAYKFTKNDPLNKMTKIILVCVAIAIVIVVIIFFLLRRKGKYR